jgi:hypothetical protein
MANQAFIIRIVFALVAVGICLAVLIYAFVSYRRVPQAIKIVAATDQRSEAIKLRLELSSRLFDISLVLLGVIWGLILAEKVQLQLSRWTDATLFAVGNLLLLLSLLVHLVYKRRVATLMWDLTNKLPDIFSEDVDYLLRAQWMFFMASLFAGLLTILSAKVLGGT